MSDRGIDRTERPRDEGLYSARIQKDKKEKGKFSELPESEDKKILFATFFGCLKKLFDTFSPSKELAGKVVDRQTLIEHLTQCKKLFTELGAKNVSTSSDFAIALSDTWCQILEDFDSIEIMERKNLKQIASIRQLANSVKNYPEDTDHRLGFYLLQHAGKDWLPFPFIEILDALHKEHQEDPKKSTLSRWTTLIDEVISHLETGLPFPNK